MCLQEDEAPTEKGRRLQKYLKRLSIVLVILGYFKLMSNITLDFINEIGELNEFINGFILYFASNQQSSCQCQLFMMTVSKSIHIKYQFDKYCLYLGFQWVFMLSLLGKHYQNGQGHPKLKTQEQQYLFDFIIVLTIVIHTICIYYCFQAYKEFKAIERSYIPQNQSQTMPTVQQQTTSNYGTFNNQQQQQKYKPFQGQGITIG